MTKENFLRDCVNGNFDIPNVGHFRIEKDGKGFISYNEMDSKSTLKKYGDFDELYNSEINGKRFSDWVESFDDFIVLDDRYDKDSFEKTGKLFG